MNRVFIDMDGTLVDYEGYCARYGVSMDKAHERPGMFRELLPHKGALQAVADLTSMGYEVWIASKPPAARPDAYAEKAHWIADWLPQLKSRLILTQHKGLLGDSRDYLIDDRPDHCFGEEFDGHLIRFSAALTPWPFVVEYMEKRARARYDRPRIQHQDVVDAMAFAFHSIRETPSSPKEVKP